MFLAGRELRSTRQPPLRTLLKQLQSAPARIVLLCSIANLDVASGDHDSGPMELVGNLLHFDADLGVVAHPFDLLTDGGEAIETVPVRVEGETNWNDVGLPITCTRKPAKIRPTQDFLALRDGQLVDDHCELLDYSLPLRRADSADGMRIESLNRMSRNSLHVEPTGALAIARHYVRELIYGANDGIITTFAVVAGVAGGGLSLRVVLIIGAANLFADGLSMAAGNYLSIRSHESVREAQALPEEEAFPFRHAGATFLAFVAAGAVPLVPYMIPMSVVDRFASSIALTLLAMFAVGASRALIANVRWWNAGFEMLGLGAVVAALAYLSGAVVSTLVGRT